MTDTEGNEPNPRPSDASTPERRDEDGLPLDRPATLDDVRGEAGSGRTIAIGCFAIVVALVIVFWLVRGGLLG